MSIKPIVSFSVAAALLCFVTQPTAEAGSRRFTYVYEATTTPPGSWEIENWVTWKTHKRDNHDYNELGFRHELEFGITDRLQAAIYVVDWAWIDDPQEGEHGAVYEDTALELLFNVSNPTTDWIGSALYGEVKVGDELFELEGKVILQKNIGRFIVAYNATIEAGWEGEGYDERNGEFAQTLGVSYEVNPNFLVGAEVLHEVEIPDWSEGEDSVVYAGPNVSGRFGKWWATLTPLVQLTDIASEPQFQTRLIVGYGF